jgi:hypothetical protein
MAYPNENSRVHVPSRSVGLGDNYPSAMVECRFLRVSEKKGIIDQIPRIQGEKLIDLRLITRKLGFLIIQLGDFDTEELLLEPLFEAITHTTSLVLMSEYVWKRRVRSLAEFSKFWQEFSGVLSHLVLVGHGSKNGLIFGEKEEGSSEFISVLNSSSTVGQAPIIISLCCKSGNGIFGKAVSGSQKCRAFIGPSGSIHAANAALFYQLFLSHSLIDGRTNEKAYQLARVFTPGVTEFNMWKKTNLTQKPSRKKVFE